jgi:four helix bundle protein
MKTEPVRCFRDLIAWQVAMELTVVVYELVKHLPADERFELSAQIRRAAISIPANVAEGQACGEDGRYIHHLRIAIGSAGELETHLELTRRLRLLSDQQLGPAELLIARVGQLLHGLLRNRLLKRHKGR